MLVDFYYYSKGSSVGIQVQNLNENHTGDLFEGFGGWSKMQRKNMLRIKETMTLTPKNIRRNGTEVRKYLATIVKAMTRKIVDDIADNVK